MSNAQAQSACHNLNGNSDWKNGLSSVIADYNAKKYQDALKTAKMLSDTICSESPTLLYTQGKIYEAMEDANKARFYFQKASEATYTFAASPDLSQKIWTARYESEHPDRTEKAVEEQKDRIQALEGELSSLKSQNTSLENTAGEVNNMLSVANTWMWTGVGTGILGIALVGTGAGLIVMNNDEPADIHVNLNNLSSPTYKIKNSYTAGWTLVGTGVALTAVGIVLAGYFGYQYSNLKEKTDIAFGLTPTGTSFSMSF